MCLVFFWSGEGTHDIAAYSVASRTRCLHLYDVQRFVLGKGLIRLNVTKSKGRAALLWVLVWRQPRICPAGWCGMAKFWRAERRKSATPGKYLKPRTTRQGRRLSQILARRPYLPTGEARPAPRLVFRCSRRGVTHAALLLDSNMGGGGPPRSWLVCGSGAIFTLPADFHFPNQPTGKRGIAASLFPAGHRT